jgi:hypothetical protein
LEEASKLILDPLDVGANGLDGLELAFSTAEAGIADHPGGTADQDNGPVTGALESREHQRGHQASDVQTVGRRIETDVDVLLARGKKLVESRAIRDVRNGAAALEFVKKIHRFSKVTMY